MKKIKMIVTLAVVLAIVGSAFAFNTKKFDKFCVTNLGGFGNCYIILNSKKTTIGVTLLYDPGWNGITCGLNLCNTIGMFTID